MKTLICYTSKQGTTLKCSKLIAAQTENPEVVDVHDIFSKNLNDYDQIFLGTPVYYGHINKDMNKFIKKNKDLLLSKELKIFTTGMDDKEIHTTHKKNFDEDIRNHAVIKYVGGGYNFEKMNFIERFIVKRIASVDVSLENIKNDTIKDLVTEHKKIQTKEPIEEQILDEKV